MLLLGLLLLLNLYFLGGDIGPLVCLSLSLLQLEHWLLGCVLVVSVGRWAGRIVPGIALRLFLILLLNEAVAASRSVASLAGLHVGELLADHLWVHRRGELLGS